MAHFIAIIDRGARLSLVAAILSLVVPLVPVGGAEAHELRPAIFSVTIEEAGNVRLRASINLEAQIAGIGSEHSNTRDSDRAPIYDRLRATTPEALREAFLPLAPGLIAGLNLSFDDERVELAIERIDIPAIGDPSMVRTSLLTLRARAPSGATTMRWAADARFGANVIRAEKDGSAEPSFSAFLRPGETSEVIPLDGAVAEAKGTDFFQYLSIGFEHIVPKGLDHILFVVGLFLLSSRPRPLLWQVTSFTLAHTVSLAFGVYGLIAIPSAIVEPLIVHRSPSSRSRNSSPIGSGVGVRPSSSPSACCTDWVSPGSWRRSGCRAISFWPRSSPSISASNWARSPCSQPASWPSAYGFDNATGIAARSRCRPRS